MSPARARKEAAKRLGLKLQADYRALVEANGKDEIENAAICLGSTFQDNIEFVIAVLKHYGGMEVRFEKRSDAPKMATPGQGYDANLRDVGKHALSMPQPGSSTIR